MSKRGWSRQDVLDLEAQLAAKDREIAALREALEIIAGKRQSIDNLMSNVEIARAALSASPAPDPAEAMSDGAIYAAVSRAKDPEAYDKMLDEVTADARAVLAAEVMRAKCAGNTSACWVWEPIEGTHWAKTCRGSGQCLSALKGNGEGM